MSHQLASVINVTVNLVLQLHTARRCSNSVADGLTADRCVGDLLLGHERLTVKNIMANFSHYLTSYHNPGRGLLGCRDGSISNESTRTTSATRTSMDMVHRTNSLMLSFQDPFCLPFLHSPSTVP